jgi:hypothetical protein
MLRRSVAIEQPNPGDKDLVGFFKQVITQIELI